MTGGTGDVNPQFLSFTATQSSANATTSGSIALPIQRLPTSGKAQVMEVLKVFFVTGANDPNDYGFEITLATKNFGTTPSGYADPRVFAGWEASAQVITTGS